MKLASEALEIELNNEEISGGEILIASGEVKLKLKNRQIEPLITITFEGMKGLTNLFNWLAEDIPAREKDDMTRESISNGIEELKDF